MTISKLKAIAVDDEQHCLDTLSFELERHCPDVEVVALIKDAKEAEAILKDASIDLLFLDIHLQSTSGITLLERILPVDFDVVFVTAYDDYALKAFDLSASHYLLKPVNGIKLKKAVDRVREKRADDSLSDLKNILETVKSEINKANRIVFPVQDGIEFIDPNTIIYIEGDSNYCTLFMSNNKKLVVSKTLKLMQEEILPNNFLRVHKSFIINIANLAKFVKSDGGYLLLDNGKKVPVSRQKKHLLSELFK